VIDEHRGVTKNSMCGSCGKAISVLGEIAHIPALATQYTAITFYQFICQEILLVWGGVKDNNLNNLKQNQNSILRMAQ